MLGNDERFALTVLLIKSGLSDDEIMKIFERILGDDYNREDLEYQLKGLRLNIESGLINVRVKFDY